LFINTGQGEVAAAGAPQGHSSGAGAKPEQPVCEQAAIFTLGGRQKLELFSLFAKHFHIQIAMGLDPAFMDFDYEGPDQAQSAFLVGEDANNMGAALKFLINAFEHIGTLEMLVVLPGQPVKGESFLDILFDPRGQFGVFVMPS
jgi:hypothetical protein